MLLGVRTGRRLHAQQLGQEDFLHEDRPAAEPVHGAASPQERVTRDDARGLGKRVARREFGVFERLALERIVHLAQRLTERRIAKLAQPRVMIDRRGRQHRLREHDALAAGTELNLAQQAGFVVDLEPFAQRSGERGFTQPAQAPKSHRRTA